MTQSKIAVVGAGTMGAGIASVFAALGWQVALYSRSQTTLDTARTIVEAGAGRAIRGALKQGAVGLGAAIVGAILLHALQSDHGD